MKTMMICVAALVTITATAAAEPNNTAISSTQHDHSLGAGLSIGGLRAVKSGAYVDASRRIGSYVFVHGQLHGGSSGSDGSFRQLRVGLELRSCRPEQRFCPFGGIDVGIQRDHVRDSEESFSLVAGNNDTSYRSEDAVDVIAVPRFGIETGGALKLRATLEVPLYRQIDAAPDATSASTRGRGMVVTGGVAYAF